MALIATAILTASWPLPTEYPEVGGMVKFYDSGLMATVAANRGFIGHPSYYDAWLEREGLDGAAALMRYGDIGRRFTLFINGQRLKLVSVDCADWKHYASRLQGGDVAEVDRRTAHVLGMRGPVYGRVIFDGGRPPQRR